ncbi:hypothetical protein PtA15_12A276 [Puccinia triticina]|uniref:Uncharacterized protein n=1 Tax=Puccinia triticina TaxID=208348 RepID=A0ABY7CZF2_9BASI|nr:uncharacterized protein PtA15_12A276 [Puccinia triticina]WAQ90288.1 hypothetical protein PtA15_12A276 [Puccinia triticina]
MSNSMQQATAFVKQLAGIQPQREEGTEDPAATPQEEVDEVPDLNPPKKIKKGAVAKEATRKIATRSTSKVPEDPPQPREAHPIAHQSKETDRWEELLGGNGRPGDKRAHIPEEITDVSWNERGQNKKARPGSASNPLDTEAEPVVALEAIPARKAQEMLVAMVERAMKAESEGNQAMATRFYDISAGLGRAMSKPAPATPSLNQNQEVPPPLIIQGLKVPIPTQRQASPKPAKAQEKSGQGNQRQSQGGYKGSRDNP